MPDRSNKVFSQGSKSCFGFLVKKTISLQNNGLVNLNFHLDMTSVSNIGMDCNIVQRETNRGRETRK
jgi:hypothetical protein